MPYCLKAGIARNAISSTSHAIKRIVPAAKTKHKRRKARSYHLWDRVGGRQIWSGFQPATSSLNRARLLAKVAIGRLSGWMRIYEIVSAAALTLLTTWGGRGT